MARKGHHKRRQATTGPAASRRPSPATGFKGDGADCFVGTGPAPADLTWSGRAYAMRGAAPPGFVPPADDDPSSEPLLTVDKSIVAGWAAQTEPRG